MIYFTSDTHAFHKNILRYDELEDVCPDIEYYRKIIINNWNTSVGMDDEVYLLGDIAVGGTNQMIKEFLNSLNGKKYLIKGNHEKEIMKCSYLKNMFEWIKDYHVMDYNKQRFVLMHYPIEEWLNKSHGAIHLHGHSHGNSRKIKNRIDVGFSANDFQILSVNDIINLTN